MTIIKVNRQDKTIRVQRTSRTIMLKRTGPRGLPGPGGSDKNFTHAFTSASSVNVPHNLGKYPAVTVMDSAGDECEGAVDHIDINNLTVTFSAPFSGEIICN